MNTTFLALCSLSLLVGCASGPAGPSATSDPGSAEAARADEVAEPTAEVTPTTKPTPLSRGVHLVGMTEVALDASARAALTLDEFGGLRLWPDLGAAESAPPVVLPEVESTWFSLARAGDDAFVVATIDTAGGARVARIEMRDGMALRHPLFELPATDPQFEIHALEGGDRILALGKDHRVRLFDATGKVLSEIDQRSFIPWQLRVVQTPGQPVALAAVLTQPVRAQALTIEGDVLRTVGEPWMVALDQSPNRNDMSLSPDGKTIAALRRHGKRGKGFAVQLIELATGNRRVIVGELDTKARPRLHYASNDRVLLESGSGKGFWIELAQAVPRDAATFPPAVMTTVSLPDAPGDLRMQVAESAGVRAIATGNVLTIDALASSDHLRITRETLSPSAVALDANGGLLAWASGTKVFVDDTARGDAAVPVGFDVGARVDALVFDEHANLVIGTGGATIVRDRTGGAVTTTGTPPSLARPDLASAARAAKQVSAGLDLRGEARAAQAAPAGSRLAIARLADVLLLSDRHSSSLVLDVFDRDAGRRLWSHTLGDVRHIAWSGDAEHLAAFDGSELVVLDATTGARSFGRATARVVAQSVSDAPPVVATSR